MNVFICRNRECKSHRTPPRERVYWEIHDVCGYCGAKAPEFSIYGNNRLILDNEDDIESSDNQNSNNFGGSWNDEDQQPEKPSNSDQFTLSGSPSRIEAQIDKLTESTGFLLQNPPTAWGNSSSQNLKPESEEINAQFTEGTSLSAIEIQKADKTPPTSPKGAMQFAYISKGQFFMGSTTNEEESLPTEHPKHGVSVPKFWISACPITESQYWAVVGKGKRVKSSHPITNISFWEAERFCRLFSEKNGRKYRLPTEAEWEHACRAGTTSQYHTGENLTKELACYEQNSTIIVEQYQPNTFGLYDMHGNVWEWCQDTWHENYNGAPTDGSAWISKHTNAEPRVIRGGSWSDPASACRSASREKLDPNAKQDNVGFRVVCERKLQIQSQN